VQEIIFKGINIVKKEKKKLREQQAFALVE
jgi:hypothetical protein